MIWPLYTHYSIGGIFQRRSSCIRKILRLTSGWMCIKPPSSCYCCIWTTWQGSLLWYGTINNEVLAVHRLCQKLQGPYGNILSCYEAGPCGFGLYHQLTVMNIKCLVIAPFPYTQITGRQDQKWPSGRNFSRQVTEGWWGSPSLAPWADSWSYAGFNQSPCRCKTWHEQTNVMPGSTEPANIEPG